MTAATLVVSLVVLLLVGGALALLFKSQFEDPKEAGKFSIKFSTYIVASVLHLVIPCVLFVLFC